MICYVAGACLFLAVSGITTDVEPGIDMREPWLLAPREIAPSVYNEEMDRMEKQALQTVFQEHMKNLFEVWMREPEPEPGGPRSIAGADKLRRAYTTVMTEIDRRIAARGMQ